tara:strand:- start:67 stop:483 length:417 start_codon:yes stop_codon:yes gene_type:complete
MTWMDDLGIVTVMMAQTPNYSQWRVDEIAGYIVPPMVLGYYHFFNKGTDCPVFVSFGFLSEIVAERYAFASGAKKRLSPKDLVSGDQPWVLDFIAPNGGIKSAIRKLHIMYPGVHARHIRRKDGIVRGRLGRSLSNVA